MEKKPIKYWAPSGFDLSSFEDQLVELRENYKKAPENKSFNLNTKELESYFSSFF